MVASPVGQSAATLNATVNPNGEQVTACSFEYGSSLPYSKSAPCTPSPGAGESAVAVAAQVSGLSPNTTYHFRISATSAGGTSVGDDEVFQTGESLPERGRCLTASGTRRLCELDVHDSERSRQGRLRMAIGRRRLALHRARRRADARNGAQS